MGKAVTTGQLIRARRLALDLTQKQVAKACRLTPSSVTQWEKDETAPMTKNIRALCAVLQCSPADLGLADQLAPAAVDGPRNADPDASMEVSSVQPIILPGGKPGLALLGQQGRTVVLEATAGLIGALRTALDSIDALLRR